MRTASSVSAWSQNISLPTYPVLAPDPNPMLFDKRVTQGSSGRIYPAPFTDRLSDQKVDQTYRAIFLENEHMQLIMIPELGGRIFAGLDKVNDYDFFYRHTVVKPGLIALFGPLDLRGSGIQLASTPPSIHLHARGLRYRGT